MRWTNLTNLPAPLAAAIRNDAYVQVGRMSVTGLMQPPQKKVLEYRYRDKITTDVSENIFSLFGQAVHSVLERSATVNEVAEKRYVVTIRGWEISGQVDLFESLHASGGLLSDYKTLGTLSYMIGGKSEEWAQQLNAYAYLFSKHGVEVKQLQIVAILRDWSKRKARRDRDYPQAGVQVISVPLWPLEKTEKWIEDRVQKHQAAESMLEKNLPPCSDAERWMGETKWAVMKEGRKSALRVFDTEGEADALVVEKGAGHAKVSRPGEAIRCQDYCKAAPFCPQLKRDLPEGVEA
jgi:hypothetical protein